jgi:hypothetical protein
MPAARSLSSRTRSFEPTSVTLIANLEPRGRHRPPPDFFGGRLAARGRRVARRLRARRQEATGHRRQRRDFVRVQRTNQARRDQLQQLGLFLALRLALEQVADDRDADQPRNRIVRVLRAVVQQPRDSERLAIAQFDVGFGLARDERGHAEPGHRHAVGEVEGADLRLDLQPNHVARNRRRELQPDAEFLTQ